MNMLLIYCILLVVAVNAHCVMDEELRLIVTAPQPKVIGVNVPPIDFPLTKDNVNCVDLDGNTALHLAVKNGLVLVVLQLLPMIEVNIVNGDGKTALYLAVSRKMEAMVNVLLKAGADPNGGALKMAVEVGSQRLVKALLKGGAVICNDKWIYPSIVCNNDGDDPIVAAAMTGHYDILKILIDEVHARGLKGDYMTHVAEMLIDKMNVAGTAMPYQRDERSAQALRSLIEKDRINWMMTKVFMVRLLLDNGAKPKNYERFDEVIKHISQLHGG